MIILNILRHFFFSNDHLDRLSINTTTAFYRRRYSDEYLCQRKYTGDRVYIWPGSFDSIDTPRARQSERTIAYPSSRAFFFTPFPEDLYFTSRSRVATGWSGLEKICGSDRNVYDLVGGSCKFFGICIDIAHRELLLCRGRIKKISQWERERERAVCESCIFMEKMLRAVEHRYYLRIVRAQAIDVTKLRNRLTTTNCSGL